METGSQPQLRAAIGILDRALAEVEALEPNRFRDEISRQSTLAGQYLAICRLGQAANTRDLRDTSDDRIHDALDRLVQAIRAIHDLVRLRLEPSDAAQQETWRALCDAQREGRFLMSRDGSLEVFLLGATLSSGGTLHVTRVWSEVGGCEGAPVDLALPLDTAQCARLRDRPFVRGDAPPHPFSVLPPRSPMGAPAEDRDATTRSARAASAGERGMGGDRIGGRRLRALVIGLACLTVLLALPLLNVIVSSAVANALGCRLDEASIYPCPFLGIDLGVLLGIMGVTGWFMLVTLPLLALLLPVWLAAAIWALVRWRRRVR